MPNVGRLQIRKLDSAAELLIGRIEIARQRAIVTGIPHRLTIDLDARGYRIESLGAPEADPSEGAAPTGSPSFVSVDQPLDLTAPREPEREYAPLPGVVGRTVWLPEGIYVAGLETTGGWVQQGESFIGFERDGSADPTLVVLEHEAGHAVELEILPLASSVRVVHEKL